VNGLKPIPEVVAINLVMYARNFGRIHKRNFGESLHELFLRPDHPRYQKPCQVYYYQTKVPEIRKYGIAASAEKRAKSGKRSGWYEEKLSVFDCSNRGEALAIEAALGHHLDGKISREEEEEWYTSIRIGIELARESKDKFDEIFLDLQQQYRAVGSKAFFDTHLSDFCDRVNGDIKDLLSGEQVVIYVPDEHINEYRDGSIELRYKHMVESDLNSVYDLGIEVVVPLEEVPELFYKRYGFKLIPDSAWH